MEKRKQPAPSDRPGEALGGVMLEGFVGEVGLFSREGSVGFGEAEGE